jgi:hypothetical protein
MSVYLQPRPDDFSRHAVVLDWPDYVLWLRGKKTWHMVGGLRIPLPPPWKPGQHWALIGKTREGKTNFAVAMLMETRCYILAIDPKGEDETLTASGWTRVQSVPGGAWKPSRFSEEAKTWRQIEKTLAETSKPVRIVVGLPTRSREDDAANKQLMSDAIEYTRESRGWTLLVDEHQVATDPRMYKIGPQVARMAISAASAKTSVMSTMQYLSWSEKAPVRQASLMSIWKTKSTDLLRKLSEECGKDWKELAMVVNELERYDMVTMSDDTRSPIVITRPPKI